MLCMQFAVGSVVALLLWGIGLLKKPEFKSDMVKLQLNIPNAVQAAPDTLGGSAPFAFEILTTCWA